MLNKDQLRDIFFSYGCFSDLDSSEEFEYIKIIKLSGDVFHYDFLLNHDEVEKCLVDLFFCIINIYKHEFLTLDLMIDIVVDDIDQPFNDDVDKNQALTLFLSNVLTTRSANLMLFNNVLSSFGVTYEFFLKKIAANIAMDKFKSDFLVNNPRFFGASEKQVIRNCISFLGHYDGLLIPAFYQGIVSNFEDKQVTH